MKQYLLPDQAPRTEYQDMDQIGGTHNSEKLEGFKYIFGLVQFFGGLLIILMLVWTVHFRGGFSWTSDPGHEFNWHPLLMTIGLVYIYGNGMLIYRSQRSLRKKKLKLIHGGMMIFAMLLTIIALVAVFDSHNLRKEPIPNMYSLHSWVGLSSVILFACQWVAGLVSFLYPGLHQTLRAAYLPIHVYFGTAGFIGVIASCLLGLSEKAFFELQGSYSKFVTEGILINTIGLIFIIFGSLVVYLVSQERYRRLPQPEDSGLIPGQSQ
ncbi:cytochrome b561 isoform X2 [Chelonus insularis]|nr:cytochrome b561 isoform X2 [Chelonus insularis]